MTKIVFMGTPDFSVPVLRRLIEDGYDVIGVVTQPDRPVGRKRVLTPPPVKVEALKHNIPVLQPEKIRLPEETEKVLALNPDLIVTAAFGQILPNDILEAPQFGCINVHASLLPELRGGAPIHYSIIQGKSETGVTIMYMVEKLDAGDMLSRVVVPIEESDHVGTLHDKLSIAGANLLSETIPPLLKGEITAKKQDDSNVSFARNIKREEELINWSKTGEEIYNHIRGLHPWPVAYTTLNGEVLKVWWGEKATTNKTVTPGEIIEVLNDGILVSTGNTTAIKITDLQPAGKKRMEAKQYINGAGSFIERGMKLGE
ncbi:methionyl-tRNA formyltransferase [Bacillus sp. AFS002410]|uniref:methionyl-tRNA formyltransferase n=1 Tax=Bacillus sp. AFS002410 TaxID=2033481 RepID=UPI000BF0257B|nr:methionyl-tRNA formyltransferase [Bacillus sp. AFS002410]PEJ60267.1 methionyl-tRNA formyltransferase [Bacillus sp. AFS002410]